MLKRLSRESFLSDSELTRFMSAVRERKHKNQPRDHALFAIIANTGIRPSEAMALRRCDVCPRSRPPHIRLSRPRRKTGPRPLTHIIVGEPLAAILVRYLEGLEGQEPETSLFPFTRRQSQRLFHYYAAKAQLPRPYKIYALRHSVGLRLWRATGDIRLIQALLGHARLKTSAVYVHISPERLRQAHEQAGTIV